MFGKIFNNKKKLEKQRLKAIEDAKSDEQKAYEKLQAESAEKAGEIFKTAINDLLAIGWRFDTRISPITGRQNMVRADVILDFMPYEDKRRIEDQRKQREIEKAQAEQATEGYATTPATT